MGCPPPPWYPCPPYPCPPAPPPGGTPPPPGVTPPPGWVWDGTKWVCDPCNQQYPCPPVPCPPVPPGCGPWYDPKTNPWYPGANAGVSFGQTPPLNPIRGNFWWDGSTLRMFDGAAWVDIGGAEGSFLPLSGGVLTGGLQISYPNPILSLNTLLSGQARTILGQTNGLPRWGIIVGTNDPETGGNNGSNLAIQSYTDGGVVLATPLTIQRATGAVLLAADPTLPLGAATKQYVDGHVTSTSIVVYTASGTVTVPPNTTTAYVQMWGATGGSGGVGSAAALAGGTGAGGYLEKLLTGLTPGNTMIYTQGAAGTAGTSAPSAGGNGGVTTLGSGTQTIATLTCNGSTGSQPATSAGSTKGTVGGTATGGDINVTGQSGGGDNNVGSSSLFPGGRNFYSIGADSVEGTSIPGNAGNPGGLKITWYP